MSGDASSINVRDLLTALQCTRQYLDAVVSTLEKMDPEQNLELKDPSVFLEPPPVMYALFARCAADRVNE